MVKLSKAIRNNEKFHYYFWLWLVNSPAWHKLNFYTLISKPQQCNEQHTHQSRREVNVKNVITGSWINLDSPCHVYSMYVYGVMCICMYTIAKKLKCLLCILKECFHIFNAYAICMLSAELQDTSRIFPLFHILLLYLSFLHILFTFTSKYSIDIGIKWLWNWLWNTKEHNISFRPAGWDLFRVELTPYILYLREAWWFFILRFSILQYANSKLQLLYKIVELINVNTHWL